jgi:enoyl-CoA hydratase/carnithine racemase
MGVKATVRRILAGVTDDDAESAALFDRAFAGADFAEGVAAFKARRAAEFPD